MYFAKLLSYNWTQKLPVRLGECVQQIQGKQSQNANAPTFGAGHNELAFPVQDRTQNLLLETGAGPMQLLAGGGECGNVLGAVENLHKLKL